MSYRTFSRCLWLSARSLDRYILSRSETHQKADMTYRSVYRYNSTATTTASPKINDIVSSISKLTLLETADLISTLKTTLNITEVAAPVSAAPAAAAPAAETAKPVEQESEKTIFNLKLESFDAAAKAKIIREVKAMLGLNLVEAKKFVESAPKVLKEGVTKEDAEKIKKALEAAGGVVKLE